MKAFEILQKAKEKGEVFLVSLTPEELKSTGFEEEKEFFNFQFVDIFLIYDNGYKLKYIFNGDFSNTLYESEKDVGGFNTFLEIINEYLSFSQ
ncbi:hypothetical protein [Sulfolobus islandicus rod-shaped virus 11]|uniref:Uncharacterized protein n=2 Tax=Usarudivirus TaxID=2843109 RepID=A0A1X9SKI7_9VIRU|nr:hypothetical protein CCL47_gp50 [Sulfolobus islandicus rod-shaped virus 11]YP_009362972.1 hypothetical protein CCL46_gp54 [Sulfolobus islandicus rod-shaped virus 4]ARQ96570.1 hypothetical protein [Sulfolobus islandicus rod-shaped virus 4]ARQ96729.1 hypothetical protein [Sulfolobus islandicus rod-shaped virus 11]